MTLLILPLFLFLLPIYLSYYFYDTIGLFMYSIAMGMSIASHCSTFFIIICNKRIRLDLIYLYWFTFYHFLLLLYSFDYLFIFSIILFHIILFCQLDNDFRGLKRRILLHVLFYSSSIITVTIIRYYKLFSLFSINNL